MSRLFLMTIGVFLIVGCSSFFGNRFSEDRIIAFKILNEFADACEKKYGVIGCAVSEAAPEGKYENLGMDFCIQRKLSKDEGRRILLAISEDLLNRINHSESLRPHLLIHPFKGRNIVLHIIVEPKKGPDVVHPDISVFGIYCDELRYVTYPSEYQKKTLQQKRPTTEVETLEEAQKIVEEQDRSKGLRVGD